MTRSIFAAAAMALLLAGCQTGGGTTYVSGASSAPTRLAFTFRNSTSYPIYYIYASPSNASSWGADILGNDVLMPGYSVTLNLPVYNTCYYDIRNEDDIGTVNEYYEVNVCTTDTVTFY
jgi:hypothetical protein